MSQQRSLANILQTDSGEDSVSTTSINDQSIQFYICQVVVVGSERRVISLSHLTLTVCLEETMMFVVQQLQARYILHLHAVDQLLHSQVYRLSHRPPPSPQSPHTSRQMLDFTVQQADLQIVLPLQTAVRSEVAHL